MSPTIRPNLEVNDGATSMGGQTAGKTHQGRKISGLATTTLGLRCRLSVQVKVGCMDLKLRVDLRI